MQENPADAKYEISRAIKVDLAAIARIYNASILEQNATAALHPVSIEEREAWFDAHEAANRQVYALGRTTRSLRYGRQTGKPNDTG